MGSAGVDGLLKKRNVRVVSFADWQVIDRREIDAASENAPRRKFVTHSDMINVLDGDN